MLSLRIHKLARILVLSVILILPVVTIAMLVYCFFSDEQKDVSMEQSKVNFDSYHRQILEYLESTNLEYTSTDIEPLITFSNEVERNIKYTVGDVEIYLSLTNSSEIERYNLRAEAHFPELTDGKTKLPVDIINDINDIISGHSYNKSDLISLVSSAYEKNSYEEHKKMFHYIAFDRNFVGFHENWTAIYSSKRHLDQYEEEFNLWGLTKQGSKS